MKKWMTILCAILIFSTAVITVNAEDAGEPVVLAESSVTVGDFTISGDDLSESDYRYENNVLTILSSKNITISGTTTADRIVVNSLSGANITLRGVNIDVSGIRTVAFEITEGSGSVTVILDGNNALTSGIGGSLGSFKGFAGLQNNSVPVTITGSGNLTATGGTYGGAGIGGSRYGNGENITIGKSETTDLEFTGTIIAIGSSLNASGAGIGGGSGGNGTNIKISGSGIVTATGGRDGGAGIGGGEWPGNGTNITISMSDSGEVKATGGENGGAGIGGGRGGNGGDTGDGNGIYISGSGTVNAYSKGCGAGIGGGKEGNGTNINISGSVKVEATSKGDFSNYGAGIGGGQGGDGTDITISGSATVEAKGGSDGGAGIGGGSGGNGTSIIISSSRTVTATGGDFGQSGGAGIGGGKEGNGTNINISGSGIVKATGGYDGAGIGGGRYGSGTNITISMSDNGKVTATGTDYGAGIGGGRGGDGTDITISGSTIVEAKGGSKGGAGIGGGSGYGFVSYDSTEYRYNAGNGKNIIIDENFSGKVEAKGGQGSAGIGGGGGYADKDGIAINGGNGENINITISSGTVTATGGDDYSNHGGGAGIGGGGGHKDNDTKASAGNGENINITISGGTVTATGGGSFGQSGGAGIGGGSFFDEDDNTTNGGNGEHINIIINGGTVTATGSPSGGGAGIGGGKGGGIGNDINISGIGGTVTATGGQYGGAGIGNGRGGDGSSVTISGGKVTATSGKDSNGAYVDTGIGGTGSTVNIKGISETSYPWVYTNKIESTNSNDDYCGIVFDEAHKDNYSADIPDGVVYGTVKLTKPYTIESGKLLRVHEGATLKTNNNLTLAGTLYLEAGAKLDKYNKLTNNGGEIKHEDPSKYVENIAKSPGKFVCDICGKEEPHNWEKDWQKDDTHHWHICNEVYDCSVNKVAFPCSIKDFSTVTDSEYGEHDYDFDNPTVENHRLYYYCKVCGHEYFVDIPIIIYLTKENGENAPLAGAEFGLYSDEECTEANRIAVGTTAINADNRAVVSFDIEQLGKTYYIKEIKAPDGYRKSDDVFKAVVSADGKVTYGTVGSETTSETVPVCKNDKIIPDSAKIIKEDGETGAPLAGAEFGIYSDEDCTDANRIAVGTTAIGTDSASDTYNKAVVSFVTEPNRTYYIKEIKAPDDYEVSGVVYKAVVDADGKVTYGAAGSETTSETVPICKNYKIIPDPAKIIKEDGETGAPLAGAEFGIYSDEECTDANRIAVGTTAIDTDSASDTYNKAVVSFATEPNRTYYIKEIKAPNGYEVSAVVYKAVVDADGKVTYGVAGSETTSETVPVCKNYAVKITYNPVSITKVDEKTATPYAVSPKTGYTEGFGTAGIVILSGITCAAFLVGMIQKRKRKNSEN